MQNHYTKLFRATLTAPLMLVAIAGVAVAGPYEDGGAAYVMSRIAASKASKHASRFWSCWLAGGMSALCHLRAGCPLDVDHEIARDRHRITLGRKQQLKHHV